MSKHNTKQKHTEKIQHVQTKLNALRGHIEPKSTTAVNKFTVLWQFSTV